MFFHVFPFLNATILGLIKWPKKYSKIFTRSKGRLANTHSVGKHLPQLLGHRPSTPWIFRGGSKLKFSPVAKKRVHQFRSSVTDMIWYGYIYIYSISISIMLYIYWYYTDSTPKSSTPENCGELLLATPFGSTLQIDWIFGDVHSSQKMEENNGFDPSPNQTIPIDSTWILCLSYPVAGR